MQCMPCMHGEYAPGLRSTALASLIITPIRVDQTQFDREIVVVQYLVASKC